MGPWRIRAGQGMQHQWQRQVPLGTVAVVRGACMEVVAAVAAAVVLVTVVHGWVAAKAAVCVAASTSSEGGSWEP